MKFRHLNEFLRDQDVANLNTNNSKQIKCVFLEQIWTSCRERQAEQKVFQNFEDETLKSAERKLPREI